MNKDLAAFYDHLKKERRNFEQAWYDIGIYHRPNRGEILATETKGTFRDQRLTHPAPVIAVNKLASRINTDLTDIALNGFSLAPIDRKAGEITDDNRWADEVSKKMRNMFLLPGVNFQSANATITSDAVTYGTGVLAIEKKDKFPYINFKAVHVGRLFLAENAEGRVDTIFEKILLTGRQLLQLFDEKQLPEKLAKKANKEPHELVTIVKAVLPSEDAEKLFSIKEVNDFAIIYFEEEQCEPFEVSGADYFPYAIMRWDVKTGECYGRSPAWDGLPYARRLAMLQIMHARATQRLLDPAVLTIDDSVLPKGRLGPGQRIDGGIDAMTNQRSVDYLTFPVDLNVSLTEESMLVDKIDQLFFVQGLPDNKNVRMTQVEVQARLAELKAMSPNVSRIINEYLNTVAIVTYKILQESKVLKKKPDNIKDVPMKFNFMGSLTNIYKFSEAESIQQLYQLLSVVGQFDPSVLGTIHHQKALTALADIYNAPLNIIKSEAELQAEQQAAQEAVAQQQQADLAKTFSEVAVNTSKAQQNPLEGL